MNHCLRNSRAGLTLLALVLALASCGKPTGGAGFIAHLARELKQPLASVVNDGGASTLVRQELHRRPALLENKRVVVWEFVERDIRLGMEGWQTVPLPPALAVAPNVEIGGTAK